MAVFVTATPHHYPFHFTVSGVSIYVVHQALAASNDAPLLFSRILLESGLLVAYSRRPSPLGHPRQLGHHHLAVSVTAFMLSRLRGSKSGHQLSLILISVRSVPKARH